jgi:hypothetical protein
MDQAAGKKTIPLFLLRNGGGIKYQVVNEFLVPESSEGNKAGDNDDN